MRSRPVFIASATLIAGTLGTAPAAQAAPGAPTIPPEGVVTTTGHLAAEVLTDAPFVLATITGDSEDAAAFAATEGTASVAFDTWGFGPDAETLTAFACETGTYVAETCSDPATAVFTPVQVDPGVDWPEDTTLGPDDAFEVTVTDPDGGGTLVALIDSNDTGTAIPLAPGIATDLATYVDGPGTVTLTRCSAEHPSVCNGTFTGIQSSVAVTRYVETTFSLGTVPMLTQTQPTAAPAITTPLRGDYELSYHFEQAGSPIVPGAVGVTGSVPSDGTISGAVEVDIADLGDGEWDLVATVTISDPAFSPDPLPATEAKVRFTVDTSGPAGDITGDPGTIHPQISGIAAYPNSVTASTADTVGVTDWVVRRNDAAPGTFVRTFPTAAAVTWNGRTGDGALVPKGSYQIHTRDALGNLSADFAAVEVTTKHVVTGSMVRDVKAGPTVVDQYVGRCSRLRRPSLRGWVGSLGFYANTRCPNTSVRASLVSTVHGITVPAAYDYTRLRISAYAGAKRSHPRSRAVLRYLTDTGKWRYEYLMHQTLGWQNAAIPASANAYIDADNRLYWGVYTLSGHRYDVAKFKVQLNYRRIVD